MLPQIAKTTAPVAGLVGKLGFSLAKSA
jgi:hypothetical protein